MGTHASTLRHGKTQDNLKGDTFFEEHGWTRVPRLVQWMATLRCPLACQHCLAADDGVPDMPRHEATRLVEQVAAMGVDEFLLTGGEPLARRDLPQIIGSLHANGVRWSLNAAMMPDRHVRTAIEQWPPCFVAVSLDGPEEVHDAFRGQRGAFDQALQSISYFADIVPEVAAGTTVTTHNSSICPQRLE